MDSEPVDNMDSEPVDNMDSEPVDNMDSEPEDNMDSEPVDNMDSKAADNMDSELEDNMDSENEKETIPDSRSLIDVIIEMQGKENRNMEWYTKAEKRMEEEVKKMNLWGEPWEAKFGNESKGDDEEAVLYQNVEANLAQGVDKNADTQQSVENGGLNQWSELEMEREIDREVDRMYIIYRNLNKISERNNYLQLYNELEEQMGGAPPSEDSCNNEEAVPNLEGLPMDWKEIKTRWEIEEVYWEMTSQVTLEKIRDYMHRLEELKQRRGIKDLSNKTKCLSCAKEMSVSTNSEVSVDLEQKEEQERKGSTSFQVSDKEVHSNDENMENNLEEEIFLVLGPYNIFEGDDVIEHIKNGCIIQLIDFGYNVYEWIKDKLSQVKIKPIFLVFTNIKNDTLHQLHHETKWHGSTGIIRIDKQETERIEEFKYRESKPISHLNLDVTEFFCKIKDKKVFSRVMFRIAIDSLTEEILTRFLNSVYAEQTLLFKQKLASMFQNEYAADWFEFSVKMLCKGESPYMYCRWAGFRLLEQIIDQRRRKRVSFWRLTRYELPSMVMDMKALSIYTIKNDFLAKHLRLREQVI
ncbi:hypothetical protein TNCT_424964 [Trichonephila clavata]|nr:hypothetical protein TNCT_424964 [Trichonephila clavata]